MRKVTVVGGNLFEIAASMLGDATMWIYLAELNRMRDPFIGGMTIVAIPAASTLQGGGVASQ